MSAAPHVLDRRRHEARAAVDVDRLREEFPILRQTVRGRPLVYLDNAATSQKPQAVLDAITEFYRSDCANVHRGVHRLGDRATAVYEGARANVQQFLGAAEAREVIFVRGATEAINLVAGSFGPERVKAGDEILISAMEHHANIVPWQMLCRRAGAHLRVADVDQSGELGLDRIERLLGPRTRLLAVTHVSNVLGTVTPVRQIVALAHSRGVPVLVDGAQAVPHLPVNVAELGCDFYAFSSHKLFGPTGIGVLYGRSELLEGMPPYQTGGGMIRSVTFPRTEFGPVPQRFEAGTPNLGGAAGLSAAIDFIQRVGLESIAAYEDDLLAYATERLREVPGLRLIGTAPRKAAILSFVLDGVHPHDLGTILDHQGIAVRAGHHCAQPLMERFGVPATTRASLAVYNTRGEIDALVEGLHQAREVFL